MSNPNADALIAIIRANGNDATTLRDAAHEAHHAIESGTPAGKWDRETINRYVTKMGRGNAARSEIRARAVEQIVCRRFGVDPGTVDHWAFIACMEAMKFRAPFFGDMATVIDLINRTMATPEAEAWADAVMALRAPDPVAKTKRTRARKVVAT